MFGLFKTLMLAACVALISTTSVFAGTSYYNFSGSTVSMTSTEKKSNDDRLDLVIKYMIVPHDLQSTVPSDNVIFEGTTTRRGEFVEGRMRSYQQGCAYISFEVAGGFRTWDYLLLRGLAPQWTISCMFIGPTSTTLPTEFEFMSIRSLRGF